MLTPADEALLRRLADGRFHSGQHLATDLNITRTAIWKQVRRLREKGLEIHSVTGRGYRLRQPLEWLDRTSIEQALKLPLGCPEPVLELHTCLDSTNTYLMQNARRLGSAHTCLVETQTAGKGRLGRRWVSPFGCNIYLSTLWRFSTGTAASGLSLAVGVVVVQALQEIGFPELQLKWPNDILWRGRKLGGILIEGISEHQGDNVVVIGLGINLWLPSKAASGIDQPWVDGRTILGHLPRRNLTIAKIMSRMLALLGRYEDQGLTTWLDDWRRLNCVLGRQVQVVQNDRSYTATAIDVTEDGLLLLEDQAGRSRVLMAGDVKLRVEGQW